MLKVSDISKKPSWMVGEMSECGNFRIDCALGVELKRIRLAHELTLMNMSEALGWGPAKLSNYEHNVGALTCPLDALTIDRYCVDNRYSLSDSAIVLAHRSVRTDLTKARELIADIRKLAGVEE